jgi:hypothetical protein
MTETTDPDEFDLLLNSSQQPNLADIVNIDDDSSDRFDGQLKELREDLEKIFEQKSPNNVEPEEIDATQNPSAITPEAQKSQTEMQGQQKPLNENLEKLPLKKLTKTSTKDCRSDSAYTSQAISTSSSGSNLNGQTPDGEVQPEFLDIQSPDLDIANPAVSGERKRVLFKSMSASSAEFVDSALASEIPSGAASEVDLSESRPTPTFILSDEDFIPNDQKPDN